MLLLHRDISEWENRFDVESTKLVQSTDRISEHLNNHILFKDKKHNLDLIGLYKVVSDLKTYNKVKPFEIELDKGNVTKCVVRARYDDINDICIVFRHNLIVTAYINERNDKHTTLDKTKYDCLK